VELLAYLRTVQDELRVTISFVEDTSRNARKIEEAAYRAGRSPVT